MTSVSEFRKSLRNTELIDTMLAERRLVEFVKQAWHVLEPKVEFCPGRHIDAICDHLEAVSRNEIRNLLVNIPPRHMKSILVSVCWPVWTWVNKPETQWLFASYAASLSTRDSLKCRRLIESPWFKKRWGDRFELTGDQNLKNRYDNNKTGYRIATSVGGAATGEGANFLVCDDPHSAEGAASDAERESTLMWWDETMSTRLNNPKKDCKVIVMQRLRENDLSGHVLKQGGYVHLCLPAEYERSRHCITDLGSGKKWQDWRHEDGELLWPERMGEKELSSLKVSLGPTAYAGQFLQRPNPGDGGKFKDSYFRYWRDLGRYYELETPGGKKIFDKEMCRRFVVMDPAGAERRANNKPCWTVAQCWAITPDSDMVLVDQYRAQVSTPKAAEDVEAFFRRMNAGYVAIEENGIGLGLVQHIQLRGVPVMSLRATANKESRAETAEIRMAAGKVFFPSEAPFLFGLRDELLKFPNGEYADQCDVVAWSSILVQQQEGAPGMSTEGDAEPVPSGRYSRVF